MPPPLPPPPPCSARASPPPLPLPPPPPPPPLPMAVPACALYGLVPMKTGLTPVLKRHSCGCCVVAAPIYAIPAPRSPMSLKTGLIPSVRPIAALLINGSGVAAQLLMASLLAAAAILGWSSMFSPLQLKSQVEISKTSCV